MFVVGGLKSVKFMLIVLFPKKVYIGELKCLFIHFMKISVAFPFLIIDVYNFCYSHYSF